MSESTISAVQSANLGFARMGKMRELKKSLEAYWKGNATREELEAAAKEIRAENWKRQADAGIDYIPSNDFSFYDQVLDHIQLFGAMPARYDALKNADALTQYFAMARGHQADGADVTAMEMTKWFDTNYHYIVPELTARTEFSLGSDKPVAEFLEAKALGVHTRPVIIGPLSFLSLGKTDEHADWATLADTLIPVYVELLQKLEAAGATDIQLDEPYLAMDICDGMKESYARRYAVLAEATGMKLHVTTYFDGLRDNLAVASSLPIASLHIDLKRAPEQLDAVLEAVKDKDIGLSLGVIDGRNIWKSDLAAAIATVNKAVEALGASRVIVAPSCSLLHTPVDLRSEEKLDDEIKNWLAFAQQKLEEIEVIQRAVNGEEATVAAALSANAKAMASRRSSARIHNQAVKARMATIDDAMAQRHSVFDERITKQQALLDLPLLPTTTIGSFPQTQEVRQMRAKHKKGQLSTEDYTTFLQAQTVDCIQRQEKIGLDVLVHGEFERNDMVEYFGEQLAGFAFTQFAWVQSYGSRCVKPPIIFGDVSRPAPMTVEWAEFAQSKTAKVMKGMLTGPVTILQWSFVRDDQPRSDTCKQIALAIRDEVVDLEKAGIKIIQIDEAALREGLPLRRADWENYLNWAVESFRITASGVRDETQIHTHMCYSEFNDIIEAVAKMDADVISIETSRSQMELLDAFVQFKYPNQIGPGVYDIHSPRVPAQEEMVAFMRKAIEVLAPAQLWVNPDCGLKTRGWKEVESALSAMVSASQAVRSEVMAITSDSISA